MGYSDLFQQQTTFNSNNLQPGTAVRVTTTELFPAVRGSYAWNALIVKVDAFEITVARLTLDAELDERVPSGTSNQRIHIEALIRGEATLELLRQP